MGLEAHAPSEVSFDAVEDQLQARRRACRRGQGPLGPEIRLARRSRLQPRAFRYASFMRLAPQETRTYFVTAVTARRRRILQVSPNAELLRKTILDYHAQNRFLLHAFVIMPDHFHAVLTPAADVSLEKAMQFIKGGSSFRLKSKLDVWERGFNESQILSAEKSEASSVTSKRTLSAVAFPLRRSNIYILPPPGPSPIRCPHTCGKRPGPEGLPPQRSSSWA